MVMLRTIIALCLALPVVASATDPSEIDAGYDDEAAAAIARIEARQAKLANQDADTAQTRVRSHGTLTGSRLAPTDGLKSRVKSGDTELMKNDDALNN